MGDKYLPTLRSLDLQDFSKPRADKRLEKGRYPGYSAIKTDPPLNLITTVPSEGDL